jgi:hypothetical protein
MIVRRKIQSLPVVLSLALPLALLGQGTFQNLGFESANVPVLPPQTGSFATVADGLPGWAAYVGSSQVNEIGHNTVSLGGAFLAILGPDWNSWSSVQIPQGQYAVFLQAQFNPPQIPGLPTASIAQTGQLPSSAQSVRFLGNLSGLQVTFNGQNLPFYALETGPNHTTYGADISLVAGLTGELRFTALQFRGDYVDAITFSNQPIPEPNTFGLFALGALLFGYRSRRTQNS